jgi:hypothetical protein
MAKRAFYRVLTSYQDNWVSHEKGAVVEIDEDKITPGENLKKMSEAEIKAWRKRDAAKLAEENGEFVVDEEAA